MTTPLSNDVLFYFRFYDGEEATARATVERLGGTELSAPATREAALELMRSFPYATHAFVGPAGRATAGADSPDGGVVVCFRARIVRAVDTVSDDSQGVPLRASLQAIASQPDAGISAGAMWLYESAPTPGAPKLVALDKGNLPGRRVCDYCRELMPVWETSCPHCGGRPSV